MDQEILEKVCNSINLTTDSICVFCQTLVVEHKDDNREKKWWWKMISSQDINLCGMRICLEHILSLNKLKSEPTAASPEQNRAAFVEKRDFVLWPLDDHGSCVTLVIWEVKGVGLPVIFLDSELKHVSQGMPVVAYSMLTAKIDKSNYSHVLFLGVTHSKVQLDIFHCLGLPHNTLLCRLILLRSHFLTAYLRRDDRVRSDWCEMQKQRSPQEAGLSRLLLYM